MLDIASLAAKGANVPPRCARGGQGPQTGAIEARNRTEFETGLAGVMEKINNHPPPYGPLGGPRYSRPRMSWWRPGRPRITGEFSGAGSSKRAGRNRTRREFERRRVEAEAKVSRPTLRPAGGGGILYGRRALRNAFGRGISRRERPANGDEDGEHNDR